uniref:NADH dehydrogenase subunit 5 n=1 Tax=Myxobolus shantungensis TaxID=904554 RepID=UPI00300242C8
MFYKNFILIFLILNFLIILIIIFNLIFSKEFSNKFYILGISILIMSWLNLYCVLINTLEKTFCSLILLSFFSMFTLHIGYGIGISVNIVLFFKIFGDLGLLVIYSFFFIQDLETYIIYFNLLNYQLFIKILVITVTSIYSLLGIFGFWIYWAMDASYFTSLYIHSCGFVAIGLVIFNKFSFLDFFNENCSFGFIIYYTSYYSCIFYLLIALYLKDLKKSFGYFSGSSICFLFWISLNNTTIFLTYFFISSLSKIIIFELLNFLNRNFHIKWFISYIITIDFISISVFLINPFNLYVYSKGFYFIFFLKFYYLIVFLIKIIILSKDNHKEILHTNNHKTHTFIVLLIVLFYIFILILGVKIFYSSIISFLYNNIILISLVFIITNILWWGGFNIFFNIGLLFKNYIKKISNIIEYINKFSYNLNIGVKSKIYIFKCNNLNLNISFKNKLFKDSLFLILINILLFLFLTIIFL